MQGGRKPNYMRTNATRQGHGALQKKAHPQAAVSDIPGRGAYKGTGDGEVLG